MSEDLPFRLRVLNGMTACLEGITIANGYKFDLAGHVFRGRLIYGEETDLPFVSIVEPPLPIEPLESPRGSEASNGLWNLLLQGFIEDDSDHPTDIAHMLMADVKKALAVERKNRSARATSPGIFGMNHRVEDIIISGGVVRPPDETSAVANFWLDVTLRIVEDLADPYA